MTDQENGPQEAGAPVTPDRMQGLFASLLSQDERAWLDERLERSGVTGVPCTCGSCIQCLYQYIGDVPSTLRETVESCVNDSTQLAAVRTHGQAALDALGIKAGIDGEVVEDPEPDQVISALANYALQQRDMGGGDVIRKMLVDRVVGLRAHESLKDWKPDDPIPEDVRKLAPEGAVQLLSTGFHKYRRIADDQARKVKGLRKELDDAKAAKLGYYTMLQRAVDELEEQKTANRSLSTQVEVVLGILGEACGQPSLAKDGKLGVLVGHLVEQRDDVLRQMLAFTQVLEDAAIKTVRPEHEDVRLRVPLGLVYDSEEQISFAEITEMGDKKPVVVHVRPEDVRAILEDVRRNCGRKLADLVRTTVVRANGFRRMEDELSVFDGFLTTHQEALLDALVISPSEVQSLDTLKLARFILDRARERFTGRVLLSRDEIEEGERAKTLIGEVVSLMERTLKECGPFLKRAGYKMSGVLQEDMQTLLGASARLASAAHDDLAHVRRVLESARNTLADALGVGVSLPSADDYERAIGTIDKMLPEPEEPELSSTKLSESSVKITGCEQVADEDMCLVDPPLVAPPDEEEPPPPPVLEGGTGRTG